MSARRRKAAGSAASSRSYPLAPLALVAVFALKLTAAYQFHRYPLLGADAGPDSIAYAELARQIGAGNFALRPGLLTLPPLYIYFVALVLWLFKSFLWVRVVQAALGTGAVALLFRTAERWHGRRAAWIAGGLAVFTGVLTFYEALLLPSALDPFLTALTLYLLSSGATTAAGWNAAAVWSGAAFGALTLNRPPALIAALLIVGVIVALRRWRSAILLTAGLAAVLMPLLVRNYVVAGDLSPASSHGGWSFYVGNHASADGANRTTDGIAPSAATAREDARRAAERAIGRALDDSDVSAHFYGRAWSWIRGEPAAAARLFARKLAYVFNAPEPSPNYSYTYYRRDEHNVLRYLPVGAWLLVPLGFAGLWLGAPQDAEGRRRYLAWASFVPAYAVAAAVYFVSSRSRLPLLIPLCVSAGAAVQRLAHAVAPRSTVDPLLQRRWYMASGAIVIGLVLAMWPAGLDDGRTEERTRMALWLIGQGRYDEAAARTSALEQEAADPGMLHFRVGRALLAREQIDAAVRHLARARDLGSKAPDADLLLGQALVAARRPKEAIPPLRRAFEAGVRRDVSGFELARAHAATGDRAGAVRVLQTVRPARPDDEPAWRRLGELALQLQVPRLGEAFLRQAVRANPSSGEALEQLGLALALSGRFEEAAGTFEKAVGANPSDASARLNLAVALAEIGRTDEARRQAEEALGLEPSYAKAREFLSKLPRGR